MTVVSDISRYYGVSIKDPLTYLPRAIFSTIIPVNIAKRYRRRDKRLLLVDVCRLDSSFTTDGKLLSIGPYGKLIRVG